MKENNKFFEMISVFISFIIYMIITIAIITESKWAYALILITAMTVLFLLWEEKMNILKLWAIILLAYSTLMLLGWNSVKLAQITNKNILVLLILSVINIFAIHSGKIIMLFLVVGVVFVKPFVKYIRRALANVIYGRLPEVKGIVKGNKRVYLY